MTGHWHGEWGPCFTPACTESDARCPACRSADVRLDIGLDEWRCWHCGLLMSPLQDEQGRELARDEDGEVIET